MEPYVAYYVVSYVGVTSRGVQSKSVEKRDKGGVSFQ
jgi:hypothetical protein